MSKLNTYLTLDGNCEEVFNFYKSVFGGEFTSFNRFSEMPEDPNFEIEESDKNKVMHVSLPIGDSTLMGSDAIGDSLKKLEIGNNFSVSITANTKDEADRVFSSLSEEGIVTLQIEKTFWGSYFGMLTAKFGIQWMVSFDENAK